MFRIRLFLVFFLSGIILLGGCSRSDNSGNARYTINLVAAIKSGKVESFDLTQLGTFKHPFVIDEETQPFSSHSFSEMDERSILVFDWDNAARVSLEDGSILAKYGRVGRGPMEYTRIRSVSCLKDTVFVRSNTKIIAFQLDGTGILEYPVANPTDNLVLLPGRHTFRFYATDFEKDLHLYDVLDADGNVLRESSVIVPTVGPTAMKYLNNATRFDGDWYSLPRHTDTIWKISETEDIPWIKLAFGSYKMPPEYLATLEGRQSAEEQFITVDNLRILGSHLFCRLYKGEYHFAIYDIESGNLLFHAKSDKREDVGIPFIYEGETHHLWPVFADEYHILFQGASQDDLWLFARK